jgi:integrase|tara:strand:- start:76 stop:1083 length:1008 start_codon:yes stop_codon:yes gene_type:complete
VSTKSAALRWGRARELKFLVDGKPKAKKAKEVPTLAEFAPRFLDGYAGANRHKPSGIAAKETILRVHLLPRLGHRKLDSISSEAVQRLKGDLRTKSPKTVNNVLATLSRLLKVAVEWGVIDEMPCAITLLKVSKPEMAFHDFPVYERLVEAAKSVDANAHLIVLLGGEAGLRCGEMMALEWADVDFEQGQLRVRQSEWKGHVTTPKGGRLRYVPMTQRLTAALRDRRHLRSPRVLIAEGRTLSQKMVRDRVRWAVRRAKLEDEGVHILRHTFCSHLAMRGAPARAIQELAGHQELSTTQRYMHLSPAAKESAIRLLDQPIPCQTGGEDTTRCGAK